MMVDMPLNKETKPYLKLAQSVGAAEDTNYIFAEE